MRRNLAKLPYPVIGRATATSTSISEGFSTSSTGGGGGGRGRGTRSPFQFTVGSSAKNESDDSKFEDAPQPPPPSYGRGRGRGQPLPPTSALPHYSSWINDPNAPPVGRGRGFVPPKTISPPPRPLQRNKDNNERSMSFVEAAEQQSDSSESEFPSRREEKLPTEISNLLAGAGRGKPAKVAKAPSEKPKVENRHVRAQQERESPKSVPASPPREEISQEEKVKRAMEILTRGDPEGGRDASEFRGGQGRGGVRGRGRGRGVGRGRYSGRGRGGDRHEESDDEVVGLSQGGPEDEEKLAKKFGPKIMNELVEVFEDISDRVLPSPIDDAYMDALHTNLLIECEPEYLMEDFGTNPDIDEKPPIPLRDALEKMKPFLMAYEGIESQEEWEEVMKETMEVTVPHMKEIVDYYSGPDRITAKQQQEELERVAKTLPPSAPDSVKRFTDRALLSLQSNPGWGFDKKCQFMDKLVMEVSQLYK